MGEAGTSAVVPAVTSAVFAATGKRFAKLTNRHQRIEAAGVNRTPLQLHNEQQTCARSGRPKI
jgi:hypothetical protein